MYDNSLVSPMFMIICSILYAGLLYVIVRGYVNEEVRTVISLGSDMSIMSHLLEAVL